MIATLAQPPVTRFTRVEAENQNLHQLRSRIRIGRAEVVVYWHDREGFYLDGG
jgi:hypothetical protein